MSYAWEAKKARPQLRLPDKVDQPGNATKARIVKNTLLIMPSRTPTSPKVDSKDSGGPSKESEEEEEDLNTTLKRMGGNVVETIGEGRLTVWVVKFDRQEHFLKAEAKLVNDKRVKNLQRDYIFQNKISDCSAINDPFFPSQWYMEALNVLPAWAISKGGKNPIGIIDSGTNTSIEDLKGKSHQGFDAIANKLFQSDVHGHGTMVATTAAATANNGTGTAGPATLSTIYPVRVGFANGTVSVSAIIKAIEHCGKVGIKIINISSNADPPFTFAHRKFNRVLHDYLEWYHGVKGGLCFNSAGNSGRRDSSRLHPYLIVVSAIDEDYSLARFSTYGSPVWFTAPGTNIYCTERNGNVVSAAGTSFSSPLCAAIAALIWGAKPSMRNIDVERILIDTCQKAGKRSWTRWFGFGMPDAEAAMLRTLGK